MSKDVEKLLKENKRLKKRIDIAKKQLKRFAEKELWLDNNHYCSAVWGWDEARGTLERMSKVR